MTDTTNHTHLYPGQEAMGLFTTHDQVITVGPSYFFVFSGYAYRLVPALDSKTDDFNPGLNMDMDPVRYVSPQTHPFQGKFRNGIVLEGAQIPLLMS
jgi:hypothetical protein